MKNLFEYRDYKTYLLDIIRSSPSGGRGLRQQFAKAAGCQLPYVSHVLSGTYHFNAEQIDGIGKYLGFREQEQEFLINLVHLHRAATPSLKAFYKGLVERAAYKNTDLKER